MKKESFVEKLLKGFGWVKQPSVSITTSGEFGLPVEASRKTEDYLKSLKGWVYTCVKARAEDVSAMKLRLMRVKDRKTGEVEEVTEHEVLSLLRKVNPWLTQGQLFEYTQSFRDLAGEAFWYLVKGGESPTSPIVEVWMLRPDYITIKASKTDFIEAYEYQVPGATKVRFSPDEIIHFKEFNPVDPYRGLSVVGAAALAVDSEEFAEKYNAKFFKNSAIPAVVLSTEQKLDDSIVKRMRTQWINEYGGPEKAHKVAILEGGTDIKPFSISHKDMEFLKGMEANAEKIRAIFRVPKSVLGMTEGVTVSNAEATDLIFAKRVVKPLMRKFVDTLNEFLLPKYKDGENLFFVFDDPIPENREQVLRSYETLFKLAAITPNEIRDREGLDTVPGLDEFYIQSSVQPLNGSEEDEESEATPRKFVKKIKVDIPHKTIKGLIAEKVSLEVKNKVISEIAQGYNLETGKVKDANEIGRSQVPKETAEKYWLKQVEESEEFEQTFKRGLIKIFNRQEANTLEALDKTQKAVDKSDIEDILFDLAEENKVAVDILVPVIKEYMAVAGEEAMNLVDSSITFDVTEETIKKFLKGRALKGIRKMNRVTRAALRVVLADAVKEGLGIPETARKIRDVFGDAKTYRAERIARTEILKAGNEAQVEAYKQSGVVMGKEWFTALDEGVCQWCQPMHGRVKSLDGNFFIQGESFTGTKGGILRLDFETVDEPPLHPQCRCVMLPVVGRSAKPQKKTKKLDKDEIVNEVIKEAEEKLDKKIGEIVDNL